MDNHLPHLINYRTQAACANCEHVHFYPNSAATRFFCTFGTRVEVEPNRLCDECDEVEPNGLCDEWEYQDYHLRYRFHYRYHWRNKEVNCANS